MNLINLSTESQSRALFTALDKSFAIIEFKPNGDIITSNDLFCSTMGYRLDEIQGRHHSIFVEPQAAQDRAYQEFWAGLGRGRFDSGEYKRISKSGAPIWLQASYTPVLDKGGKVVKVVKLALDITKAKMKAAEDLSLIQAIFRSQAVIEFTLNGEILNANDNFLKVVGYDRDEIVGRHHRMFAEPAYTDSAEYHEFWKKLAGGEFLAAEFRRVGKGGREIWLQASYNPVFVKRRAIGTPYGRRKGPPLYGAAWRRGAEPCVAQRLAAG
jgi:methyl-accepting chemotaxis protein